MRSAPGAPQWAHPTAAAAAPAEDAALKKRLLTRWQDWQRYS